MNYIIKYNQKVKKSGGKLSFCVVVLGAIIVLAGIAFSYEKLTKDLADNINFSLDVLNNTYSKKVVIDTSGNIKWNNKKI